MSKVAAIIAVSYMIGAIPFGLIIGYICKGIDIREHGSGNIGASNVLRLVGWPAALVAFLLDTGKGLVPVVGTGHLTQGYPAIIVCAGLAAIVGHNFSVFLRFKGGKGVATSLGVLVGIAPEYAAVGFLLWIVLVAITRYISLSSIIAGTSAPLLMLIATLDVLPKPFHHYPREFVGLGLAGGLFIVLKHRSNIVRLRNGTEPKFGKTALESPAQPKA